MENVLNSLEAAVLAAGMATAYVADDWPEFVVSGALVPLIPSTAH